MCSPSSDLQDHLYTKKNETKQNSIIAKMFEWFLSFRDLRLIFSKTVFPLHHRSLNV